MIRLGPQHIHDGVTVGTLRNGICNYAGAYPSLSFYIYIYIYIHTHLFIYLFILMDLYIRTVHTS